MTAASFRVRTPDGVERTLLEAEIETAIALGTIDLDAMIAAHADDPLRPITQHRTFQAAFERRMGLGPRAPDGSDDTPTSNPTPLDLTPPRFDDDHHPLDPKTPVTQASLDELHSDTLPAMVHPDESFDTADLALTSQDNPLPSGTFPPVDPAPIGHGASPPIAPPDDRRVFHIASGLTAWAFLVLVLYFASIVYGGGRAEAEWLPSSAVLWVRIALTGGLGGVLVLAFHGMLPLRSRAFRLTWQWAGIAVLAGTAVGAMAPNVPARAPLLVAIVLAATVAIAEEVFFRGFLGRVLLAAFDKPRVPIAIGAVLYGAYYATYFVIWQRPTILETVLALTMITVGAGLPYALLQDLTKGVTAPLLCHVAVNVVGVIAHLG